MREILSRCGYRCDLCLAYRPNVERDPSSPQTLSDGWFKYFGFRVPAEHILCDGCLAVEGKAIDEECPVRPCAIARGVDHCAQCDDYVCDKLKQRLGDGEEISAKFGEIPADDYVRFIRPYDSKERLEELRKTKRG
jgi:hypothetical protein